MKNRQKNSLFHLFIFLLILINFINRTKEIGESSKTILEKKTNKSSNQRSSTTTTVNNSIQTRTNINTEQHLSPTNNQLLSSERPLRFIFFILIKLFYINLYYI